MATDNSPPRLRVIIATMAVSVFILVSLKFGLDSYYLSMMEGEEFAKVGSVPATDLMHLRAAEKKNLTTGKVPIDRAMKELAAKGRDGTFTDLSADIAPQNPEKEDTGPLIGWVRLAKAAPDMPGAAAPATASDGGAAPATASDGGAALVGQAGASTAAAAGANLDGGPTMAPMPIHGLPGANTFDAGLKHPGILDSNAVQQRAGQGAKP
jgi:hypothetical protein